MISTSTKPSRHSFRRLDVFFSVFVCTQPARNRGNESCTERACSNPALLRVEASLMRCLVLVLLLLLVQSQCPRDECRHLHSYRNAPSFRRFSMHARWQYFQWQRQLTTVVYSLDFGLNKQSNTSEIKDGFKLQESLDPPTHHHQQHQYSFLQLPEFIYAGAWHAFMHLGWRCFASASKVSP